MSSEVNVTLSGDLLSPENNSVEVRHDVNINLLILSISTITVSVEIE